IVLIVILATVLALLAGCKNNNGTPPGLTPPGKKPVKIGGSSTPLVATNKVTIITGKGTIVAELYGNDAPNTVKNFVSLIGKKFYDGLTFHRVETKAGFQLIQGGDPKGDGTGDAPDKIKLEISPKLRHWEGALAMARSQDRNSASCQFYICNCDIKALDGDYAVFGKVIEGLDVAKKIAVGDKMTKVTVETLAPAAATDDAKK
ncbi:MAG: peptidylprolyl isomerase, partial [bacterium]